MIDCFTSIIKLNTKARADQARVDVLISQNKRQLERSLDPNSAMAESPNQEEIFEAFNAVEKSILGMKALVEILESKIQSQKTEPRHSARRSPCAQAAAPK